MKQNIIHIGLDVDEKQYHGSALNEADYRLVASDPTSRLFMHRCIKSEFCISFLTLHLLLE